MMPQYNKIFQEMQNIFLKNHLPALLLALLVGSMYVGPDLYHQYTPEYQGIVMADSGDADFYLTIINKNYGSTGCVQNPFNFEYRDTPTSLSQYFLIQCALGKVGTALHLSIDSLLIAMEFIFPALLTLLLYVFTYWISKSRLTSIVVAGAMLLGTELVHPDGLSNLFNTFLFRGHFTEFLAYSRPVNPQVSALFFFSALMALYNLLTKPRSKWVAVLAGIGVGMLAYIYPYYWVFAVVVLGVIGLYALAARNWQFFSMICLAGVVTLFTMTPFLLANLSVFLHGGSGVTQSIPIHRVIIEKIILLPLFLYGAIFGWAWRSRGEGRVGVWAASFAKKYFFILILLVAGVIVSNHQVIDGKLFYQQHFHFFTNIPVSVLAMTILSMEVLTFARRSWRFLGAGIVIVVCTWFGVGVQIASYRAHSVESMRYQALAPIFTYLHAASHNAVILSDSYLSTRQTIYTQNYSYSVGGMDAAFGVPQEQVIHDYFVMLALRGVTADKAHDYMYKVENRNEIGGAIFIGTYWRDLCGSYSCFPDSVLEDLVSQYAAFLKQPLLEAIKTHRIDYILQDTAMEPDWKLSGLVRMPPVFENGDFTLYAIHP